MKKLLSILTVLIAFSANVSAYDFKVNGLCYNICEDGKSVVVTHESYTYVHNVPDSTYTPYERLDSTNYENLNGKVVIPKNVNYNGKSYLVTKIGEDAFNSCSHITSVTIPNSVSLIDNAAFAGCKGLTSAIIPNSVTTIGSSAFQDCSGIKSIKIPNSVTEIGWSAFAGCTGLTSIIIPNSVTTICTSAFRNCSGIKSIKIPNSVTEIGSSPFEGCNNLSTIIVEKQNTSYDSRNNCNAIIETESNILVVGCKNSTIPNSVTKIGSSAFSGCTGLTSITIPESVTEIGSSAFSGCTGLKSITIPNSVIKIGSSAFEGCTGLTSITIPESVTEIGSSAFEGCTGLTSITIPNSVTSIDVWAFRDCTGLTSVTMPSSLTEISWSAFEGCTSLNNIVFRNRDPKSIISTKDVGFVFKEINNSCKIQVPLGTIDLYRSTYPWYFFTNIVEYDYSFINENHTETLYVQNIDSLKQQYQNNGYYVQATEARNQLLQNPKFLTDSANLDFINDIADDFTRDGEFDKAIACYKASCEIYKNLQEDNRAKVAETQNMIGYCYYRLKDFDKAIDSYEAAIERYLSLNKDNSYLIAKLYEKIGDCHISKNEFDNSISYYSKAAELYEYALSNYEDKGGNQLENEETKYYLNISNIFFSLCKCHVAMGQFNEASHWYICYLNSIGYRYDRYPNTIIRKPILKRYEDYFNQKKYDEAIKFCSQAILFYENIGVDATIHHSIPGVEDIAETGKDYYNHDVADMNEKIGKCYYAQQDYPNALRYYKKALNMLTPELDYHDVTEQLNEDLAFCYLSQRDYVQAYNYLKKVIDYKHKNVISFFSYNTLQDCSEYWKKESILFQNLYPSTTLETYQQATSELERGEMLGDLYNKSALFAKGLLLTSELEFSRIIHESKNPNLIKKYQELKKNNNNDEARKLLDIAGEYGDYMKKLQLTWQDVQKNLGKKSIAIEFLSFPKLASDSSIIYIALTVKPGDSHPEIFILCDEKDLTAAKDNAYNTPKLSQMIWGRLAEELNDVDTIYFSPSGELHTINIESMPHWQDNSTLMCNKYKIYRLSSTRELAMKTNRATANGTALYGGIKYDCDIDGMSYQQPNATNAKTPQQYTQCVNTRSFDYAAAGFRDDTSWDYLPGTLSEVNSIKELLGNNAEKYTACNATETSFKNLPKKRIIHIATHGFYWNDSTARQKDLEQQLSFRQPDTEDEAMTRTGLLFSGGENAFKKNVVFSPGYDDGVLTAQEISQLDLRGLELVVLSACQTGLGDIVGSEGVFGLQRGFKKAGAQSIIMSLWNADDDATKDMMTFFYTHLKKLGMDHKYEAFLAAQKEVKDKDDKGEYSYWYEDKANNVLVKCNSKINVEKFKELRRTRPHWATFILLDAIKHQIKHL